MTTTLAEALAEICAMDVPLGERLTAYAKAMRDLKSPFADEYDRLVDRLRAGDVGRSAPAVGEPMPPFLLPDPSGHMVSLEELVGRGPAVVSFNRGHWCPFCKLELGALAEAQSQFAALGAQVVSIMPERQPFTVSLQANLGSRLLVLTDTDNGYALSLGLVMWVGERIHDLMVERNLRLDQYQGNDAWFLPLPATFVVGRDGRVRARFVDPNFRSRMEVPDILDALRSA